MNRRIETYLLAAIVVIMSYSCTNNRVQDEEHKTNDDSATQVPTSNSSISALPEPFVVSDLERTEGLQFTSGVLSVKHTLDYCDDYGTGIYGRYYLVGRSAHAKPPHAGFIDVYKTGKDSGWYAGDKNQKIWRIQLKSPVITLWDSITVDIPYLRFINFVTTNGGTSHYLSRIDEVHQFTNFKIECTVQNDSIRSLDITRVCEK